MSNKLTVTYQNAPIINEKEIEGDAVVSYKGTTVQTISAGEEVKLNTKDKYTSDFITIGGEKLNTKGKIIKDFININVKVGAIIAPPYTTGDINEIKDCLDAYYAGGDVDFSAWSIGDQRPIDIDGMPCQLTLAHKFTEGETTGNAYRLENGKLPAYAIVCIPLASLSIYMQSYSGAPQIYFESALHTHCNTTQYNKIKDIDAGQLFKPFQCYVGRENTTSSAPTVGTYNQKVYLASLACKEVGLTNEFNADENNALINFSYFDSAAKRQTLGPYTIWLRSPFIRDKCYTVNGSSGSRGYENVASNYGVVWFGCI